MCAGIIFLCMVYLFSQKGLQLKEIEVIYSYILKNYMVDYSFICEIIGHFKNYRNI